MQAQTTSSLPLSVNPFEALVNANVATAATKAAKKSKKKPSAEVVSETKDAETVAASRTKPDSKRSRAVIIYKESIGDGKKVVIDRFKTQLSMTDAGANSYFYATKKAVTQ